MEESSYRKCPRCKSTMTYDKFFGPTDGFWGWKCVMCGEILDPVILENRNLMRLGHTFFPERNIITSKLHP